jgi:hypothetical protein
MIFLSPVSWETYTLFSYLIIWEIIAWYKQFSSEELKIEKYVTVHVWEETINLL